MCQSKARLQKRIDQTIKVEPSFVKLGKGSDGTVKKTIEIGRMKKKNFLFTKMILKPFIYAWIYCRSLKMIILWFTLGLRVICWV